MLKYRIERFFRTKDNLQNFKKVVYMIDNNLSLSEFRDKPMSFIWYMENHDLIKNFIGRYKFTDLGEKYHQYYLKNMC